MTTPGSSVASKFPTEAKDLATGDALEVSKPKSKPIAGFVSTSVLSSSDGLFGDNVEEVRITDRPESSEEKVDFRPLYERLKEQKDARDADWKDKNNPFAPPKGLDDEEIDFLHTLESDQKKLQDDITRHHDEELAHFGTSSLPLEKQGAKVAAKVKAKTSTHTGNDHGNTRKKQKTVPVASLVAAYSDDDSA
ncbi:hypothetical protein DYB28_003872 [Aphanomyces astaci]|uniref:FAM192A/Fyv6 N-terminal domain-containing protein n=1 Tax=Aphanomyces astaci TaxID=112090 RepID=A0A397EFU4_APHAT|nr:hypothetical protein DYB25_006587 [Aphanomyces astaci]RHY43929.1 hypothetical protein DYB34_007618 [Aphanomyces astaci]RHY55966.1 hypothetical protein DYB38_004793 [Aphanomyces astaci]RHY56533.1 hypothetical protein DYB30_010800 [Aphanomyces astaci]RHY78536.1 hypothetical protein DYB31_007378 [Aphanomyces astaci]